MSTMDIQEVDNGIVTISGHRSRMGKGNFSISLLEEEEIIDWPFGTLRP
jgi:hypothetical protein